MPYFGKESEHFSIADLGSGVGHGCYILSEIRNSTVTGIDISRESIEYAMARYHKDNIQYRVGDLKRYIPSMPKFGYVVSRNVFEHVPNGLELTASVKWHFRVMIDTPYEEKDETNPHHLVHGINEKSFHDFPDAELFYQDLKGAIYDKAHNQRNQI